LPRATVLITGSNRGIGLELARQYAADGWDVLATCRDPSNAAELAELAAQSPDLAIEPLDVSDWPAVAALGARLAARPLDVVLANAGVWGGSEQGLEQLEPDAWLATLAVNTVGPVMLLRALLPSLRRGSGRRFVAISSGMGSIGANRSGGWIAYRSSKAALNAAVRSAGLDLAGQGIVAAVLSPGWVRTDMGGSNATLSVEESASALRSLIARLGPTETGGFYDVDGGELAW
jgi:NAD(P)-dependent dehydrogenase (short-subunit alcohol dehydrogenase family)